MGRRYRWAAWVVHAREAQRPGGIVMLRRHAYAGDYTTTTGRTRTSAGYTLARVIRAIGAIVAGIIVLGIVLRVLGANPSNDLVNAVLDAARWLVGPFKGLFSIHDADWRVIVN